jgi:GT2 family glycosyltransferase
MIRNTPKVAVIILTYNNLQMTRELLLDVAKLDVTNLSAKCIVVDNGSTDGTEADLKDYKLKNMEYKFIRNLVNVGFAGGNNVGIKHALKDNSDYVLVMNNDLILPKDLITKLVRFMESDLEVGVASPKIYFAKGYEFHKNRYKDREKGKVIWFAGGLIDKNNVYTSHRGVDEVDIGQFDEIKETDLASGACMIVRNKVFSDIGLLDERLFLYWDDADFSERARRAGYKVKYYPEAHVWHKVSISTGGSGGSSNDYFLTRNRFYYSMHYSSIRTKLAVIKDTLQLALFGRRWQRLGAFDALLGRNGRGGWNSNG